MKKILLSAIAIIIAVTVNAQERTLKIYKNGEITHSISIADIDSMKVNSEYTDIIAGHKCVDLGLPSGLKWAACNIGATNPEDYGNYYAWGETTTKSEYIGANNITSGIELGDISGSVEYDAARANWGGSWRMPTIQEMTELTDECTWELVVYNGLKIHKVTGPNGNTIYLPLAGFLSGTTLEYGGEYGYYWSSTPSDQNLTYRLRIGFHDEYFNCTGTRYRSEGLCIRPVTD